MDSGYMGQYVSGTYYNTTTVDVGSSYKTIEQVSTAGSDTLQQTEIFTDGAVISMDRTLEGFVTAALKEAGLVRNERTMKLVQVLLEQHLPVNKETLVAYNRLMTQNPGTNIATLVAMQKNNINITPAMIEQFENYKANEHQLMKDISSVTDDMSNVLKSLFTDDKNSAVAFLEGIGRFVETMGGDTKSVFSQNIGENTAVAGNMNAGSEMTETIALANTTETIMSETSTETAGVVTSGVQDFVNKEAATLTAFQGEESGAFAGNDAEVLKNHLVSKASFLKELVQALPDSDVKDALQQLVTKQLSNATEQEAFGVPNREFFGTLARIVEELPKDKAESFFEKLDTKEFKQIVRDALNDAVFMKPEEAADKEKAVKYYKKLGEAVSEMTETLSRLGEKAQDSALGKAFNKIADNVSFMNQINEWIPYIQLPIKLAEDKAHGDFYVMKRKKAFQNGETLAAFLRLNMEHLGELDIMVKLKDKVLDIDIKAEKKDIVAFIDSNLHKLESGLRVKGYMPTMTVGEKEKDFDFEKDFLDSDSAEGTIGRYSFDMKI